MVSRLLAIAAVALIAWPALGTTNSRQTVMALTEVATDAPVIVDIDNVGHTAGYLVIKTENEVASADLAVVIRNVTAVGLAQIVVCTLATISTETTTVILMDTFVAAGEGINDVCAFPLSRLMRLTFVTTGVGAAFDVTAEMQWIVK